ncbi:Acetate operon repressor [Serratia entomophila]|uniref:IclR family transcriptional regulator n=1 Tax=Serratia entomophila TaxID=42906 RepID=UPI00217C6AA8|nr:IclR family transcriptional regulator [Serratia entomophila]CAI1147853.1 Acetate operon repressor [Serratia entomophila]CAI1182269.1 Acetate operon repressor [Serratia entomophila]CAI2146583.1 Acetate operon repressor [Serratia entomophila]
MIDESRKIQSVERAMSLLETIAASGGDARLVDLAERSGLHKSTIYGLLNTLASMGYITRSGTRYSLGLRLRAIAQTLVDSDQDLKAFFAPMLQFAAELSGEACYLAVPCGTREYLYLDAADANGPQPVFSGRGRREGMLTSAIGRVLLADKPDIIRSLRRAGTLPAGVDKELLAIIQRGYALDLQEAEPGLHCLALPLRRQGKIVAALGISGPAQRLSQERMQQLAGEVMRKKFGIIKQ